MSTLEQQLNPEREEELIINAACTGLKYTASATFLDKHWSATAKSSAAAAMQVVGKIRKKADREKKKMPSHILLNGMRMAI